MAYRSRLGVSRPGICRLGGLQLGRGGQFDQPHQHASNGRRLSPLETRFSQSGGILFFGLPGFSWRQPFAVICGFKAGFDLPAE